MEQDNKPGQSADQTAGQTIDQFAMTVQAGHLIRRCQQRAVDLFTEEVSSDLGDDGPTPRQFAVLLAAHQEPGINQTDLVRKSGIDRSTLTEILRRLIDRKLIRREKSPTDGRTNALFITKQGETLVQRALPAVIRAQQRILEPIAQGQMEDVMAALEILAGD
jgi:DNA-binding MarR family transcriptional regulator